MWWCVHSYVHFPKFNRWQAHLEQVILPMNCTSIKMIKNKSMVDGRGALGFRKWTLAKDLLEPV